MDRADVFAAIDREQAYNEHQAGPTMPGDETSIGEWLLAVEDRLAVAKDAWVRRGDSRLARRALTELAAEAVAALEQHGAVERPWTLLGREELMRIRWYREIVAGAHDAPTEPGSA